MRVIKVSRVKSFWARHPKAKKPLEQWLAIVRHALWKSFHDLSATYSSADQIKVASGKTVVVFNIGGNNYRLVCAAHYNRGKLFVLDFMTHAEYSKDTWKERL